MAFNSGRTPFRNALAIVETLSPAIVATITVAEQLFTVPGVPDPATTPSIVMVNKPTVQAGLGLAGARASAANQVGIAFVNPTAAGITPTAGEAYNIVVLW